MRCSYFLSVNGFESNHFITTHTVSKFDLLAWLDQQTVYPKFYWKPRGDLLEYAAVGALLFFNAIPEFSLKNRSPASFYGGMQFYASGQDDLWQSYPKCYFFLPEWEIIQDHEKAEIRHYHFTTEQHPFKQTQSSLSLTTKKAIVRKDYPNHLSWKDLVQKALVNIRDQEFQKVVLARKSSFQIALNPYALLNQLKNPMQTSTLFAFQYGAESAFIGATPEFLYERSGQFLSTEAIAGTRDRVKFQEGHDLLVNSKDFEEVKIVKDALKEKLSDFVTWNPENQETAHIISTAHVDHLRFSLKATLNKNINDPSLISLLHPTPAINGYPAQNALSFILKHEPFARGYYSAPLGRISETQTQIAVGIRSSVVEKEWIHLFSGAGIVEKSDPDQEWEELESKIKQFKEWICP